MRDVAVTEGDKVAAQIQFGYEVNGYSLSDLTSYVDEVGEGRSKPSWKSMKRATT